MTILQPTSTFSVVDFAQKREEEKIMDQVSSL